MKQVVVVAPHPDDEVLGCGGVMAAHSARGDAVHVVIVTRGSSDLFTCEELEITRAEAAAAHAILGVRSTRFLDFPAPKLDIVPLHAIADALRAEFSSLKPDLIYVCHFGDLHHDHSIAFHATMVAARPVGGMTPHILTYETLSETDWAFPTPGAAFIPTAFVDITSYIEVKMSAMACYKSQLKAPPHARSLKALRALAELRGATAGLRFAEAFVDIRRVECLSNSSAT